MKALLKLNVVILVLSVGCVQLEKNQLHFIPLIRTLLQSSDSNLSQPQQPEFVPQIPQASPQPLPQLLPPVFLPTPGLITILNSITIQASLPTASIYYTTDGTIPTTSSNLYTTPIKNIWALAGRQIRAFATNPGYLDSPIATGVYAYLPLKTGQYNCWNESGLSIPCSGTGQDGELQLGVTRGFNLNPDTVTDVATGLIWQKCLSGQTSPSCTGTSIKLNWISALNYCNTLTLAGKTWRLPNIQELATLIRYGTNPAYYTTTFLNGGGSYWSSTTSSLSTSTAWIASWNSGTVFTFDKTNSTLYQVRCVSGPSRTIVNNFTDNGDGTVTDHSTGLLWQKCSRGQTNDYVCSGIPTTSDWNSALNYCNTLTLAGKIWRLPNIRELYSLVDTDKTSSPSINTFYFINTLALDYASSTTNLPVDPKRFWFVNFYDGSISNQVKTYTTFATRCVSGP